MHFQQVADEVKAWKPYKPTSNEQKLQLYALYKQATEGDAKGDRPGLFAGADRAKWDAWKALEGKDATEMKSEYIEEAQRQMREHSEYA